MGSVLLGLLAIQSFMGSISESSETGNSGIIISDPFAAPAPSIWGVYKDPPLDIYKIPFGFYEVSGLWGIEMIGADLAKEDLRDIRRAPAHVVVCDNGVSVGALHSIEVPGTPRKPKMIRLRFTRAKPDGMVPKFINELLDKIEAVLPEEIPDPQDPTQKDDTPHANHVAGTIGALNAEFGVSPYAEITDLNIFKGMNLFKEENLVSALETLAASKQPVDVVNMSHAIPDLKAIRPSLDQMKESYETVFVAAAGNDSQYIGKRNSLHLARDLVVVGALSQWGTLAFFSNYGASMDIVAPGELILSRGKEIFWRNEKLQVMSGTSMAAPMVTGTFATLKALLPRATAEQLKQIVFRTAVDLGKPGKDLEHGHGLLNELRAVAVAKRLIDLGLNSRNQIDQALTVESSFQFEELARQAKIEALKAGSGSQRALRLLRKSILLRGKVENFSELSDELYKAGDSTKAAGWLIASLNSPEAKPSPEHLSLASSELLLLQLMHKIQFNLDFTALKHLQNPDLYLGTLDKMPPEMALAYVRPIAEKLFEMAPEKLGDLAQLVERKKTELSAPDPVVALKMAP